MPVDSSPGIFLLQLFDEGFHGSLLLGRTGVFRLAVLRQTADVADTDAHKIVTSAVGAYFFYRTAHVDAAVTINYKMIADAEKATISMPAVDVGYGVITTFLGRATMNDNFLDFTHDENKFKYDLANPKNLVEIVFGGMLLGYPIESTVAVLNCEVK